MPAPIPIEIYSRPGCHLCDEAKAVIERYRGQYPMTLRTVNVETSADLESRYGEEIPVIFVNGVEAFRHRIDGAELEEEAESTVEHVDVLTIAAHPDDIELTCAGTLCRMVHQGYSVGILDLTQGEMGTRGTPEIRAAEAEAARKAIGARFRERMNLGDSQLTSSIENRMAVARMIRIARPRTVILPYWEGRHPDHYTASILGYEACYAAGLKRLPIDGEPHRPKKILYASMYYWDANPSFVVDISPFFAQKLEAINCYASQFAGDMRPITELYPAWGKVIDRVTTQCKYYGHVIGAEYGEPFVIKEPMAVDDIVKMPVDSI